MLSTEAANHARLPVPHSAFFVQLLRYWFSVALQLSALTKPHLLSLQIDWHDFVVVETIDFYEDEDEELPPPMSLKDLIRFMKEQTLGGPVEDEDGAEGGPEAMATDQVRCALRDIMLCIVILYDHVAVRTLYSWCTPQLVVKPCVAG